METWERRRKEKNQQALELYEMRRVAALERQDRALGSNQAPQTVPVLPARRISPRTLQYSDEDPLATPQEDRLVSPSAPSVLAVRRIVSQPEPEKSHTHRNTPGSGPVGSLGPDAATGMPSSQQVKSYPEEHLLPVALHLTPELDLDSIRKEIASTKSAPMPWPGLDPEPEPEPEPEMPVFDDGGDLPKDHKKKKERGVGHDLDKAARPMSGVDEAVAAGVTFVFSPQFDGYKEGYVFKEGTLGKGYYNETINPAEKLGRTAEVLADAVEAERAKRRELEERLAEVDRKRAAKQQAQRLGFTPNTSGRGPAHVPHFLWPTYQHSTSFGKARYTKTKAGISNRHGRGPNENTNKTQAEAMFKYERSGGLRSQTLEGEQPRGKSRPLHIQSPDVDKMADEVKYPGKHKDGVDQLALGGDGTSWEMHVSMPVHKLRETRDRLGTLEASMKSLHRIEVADWDGKRESALHFLQNAAERYLAERTVDAENQLEKWSKVLDAHPEQVAMMRADEKAWEEKQKVKNQRALDELRAIVPAIVRIGAGGKITKRDIHERAPSMSRELLTRVWKKRVLWFIWMDPADIKELHYQELDVNYWYHGLDLRELRAVYSVIPKGFSAGDPMKQQWHDAVRERIDELDKKDRRGRLGLTEWMHPCYLATDHRILHSFYRRVHPQFATGSRIYSVCQAFYERAESSGEHWQDVMYDRLADKYGRDPRDDDSDSDYEDPDKPVLVVGGYRVPEITTAQFGASHAALDACIAVQAEPILADSELTNALELRGHLAIIRRGACSFVSKARRAQQAGCIGVIFVNTDEELFLIGGERGDSDITIPIVGITASDGDKVLHSSDAHVVSLFYTRSDDDSGGYFYSSNESDDDTAGEDLRPIAPPLDLLASIRLEATTRSQARAAVSTGNNDDSEADDEKPPPVRDEQSEQASAEIEAARARAAAKAKHREAQLQAARAVALEEEERRKAAEKERLILVEDARRKREVALAAAQKEEELTKQLQAKIAAVKQRHDDTLLNPGAHIAMLSQQRLADADVPADRWERGVSAANGGKSEISKARVGQEELQALQAAKLNRKVFADAEANQGKEPVTSKVRECIEHLFDDPHGTVDVAQFSDILVELGLDYTVSDLGRGCASADAVQACLREACTNYPTQQTISIAEVEEWWERSGKVKKAEQVASVISMRKQKEKEELQREEEELRLEREEQIRIKQERRAALRAKAAEKKRQDAIRMAEDEAYEEAAEQERAELERQKQRRWAETAQRERAQAAEAKQLELNEQQAKERQFREIKQAKLAELAAEEESRAAEVEAAKLRMQEASSLNDTADLQVEQEKLALVDRSDGDTTANSQNAAPLEEEPVVYYAQPLSLTIVEEARKKREAAEKELELARVAAARREASEIFTMRDKAAKQEKTASREAAKERKRKVAVLERERRKAAELRIQEMAAKEKEAAVALQAAEEARITQANEEAAKKLRWAEAARAEREECQALRRAEEEEKAQQEARLEELKAQRREELRQQEIEVANIAAEMRARLAEKAEANRIAASEEATASELAAEEQASRALEVDAAREQTEVARADCLATEDSNSHGAHGHAPEIDRSEELATAQARTDHPDEPVLSVEESEAIQEARRIVAEESAASNLLDLSEQAETSSDDEPAPFMDDLQVAPLPELPDTVYLRRFYRHHSLGIEAARAWGTGEWGEAEWEAKFEKIIGTYKKKAAKAASKDVSASDYRELMFGALQEKYGVDPRSILEQTDSELAAEAMQMARKAELSRELDEPEVAEQQHPAVHKPEQDGWAVDSAVDSGVESAVEHQLAEQAVDSSPAERSEAEMSAGEQIELERSSTEKAKAQRVAAERGAEEAEAARLASEEAEAAKIAAEEAEAARMSAEEAEAARLAAEDAEATRLSAEEAEAARMAAEEAEAARLAAEEAEAARLAAEEAEADRLAAEEAEAARMVAEEAEANQSQIEQPRCGDVQVISSENEVELEVNIGDQVYLVDKESGLVFQLLDGGDSVDVGTWDEVRRLIDFVDVPLDTEPETAAMTNCDTDDELSPDHMLRNAEQRIVSEDENDIIVEIGQDAFLVDIGSGIVFQVVEGSEDMPEVGDWDEASRQIVFHAAEEGDEVLAQDSVAPAKMIGTVIGVLPKSTDTPDEIVSPPTVSDSSCVPSFIVVHNYDPQGQEGCMALAIGQRVVVTDWSHAEWWIGHLEGDPSISGAFPVGFVAEAGPAEASAVDDGSQAAVSSPSPGIGQPDRTEPADTGNAPEARAQHEPKQIIVSEDENDIMVEIGDDSFMVDISSGIVFRVLLDSDDLPEVGTWDTSNRRIVFAAEGGGAAGCTVVGVGSLAPELVEPVASTPASAGVEEAMPPQQAANGAAELIDVGSDGAGVGASSAENVVSVLHNYDPQGQEGCMALAIGQRVVVTDWSHAEWWIGHLEGDPSISGAFPVGFVAEAGPAEGIPPTQEVEVAGQEAFVCAYEYDPQGAAGCLCLAVGDRVLVDEPDDALDWWTGQLERDPSARGAFPAAFVVPAS